MSYIYLLSCHLAICTVFNCVVCLQVISQSSTFWEVNRMDEGRVVSVVMLPFLARGHVSPFLELAKKLSERSFLIHICSTPINLAYVGKCLGSSSYSTAIQLVELQLPSLPDLPSHCHTTNGLPPHLVPALIDAFAQSADPNFSNILKSLSPDLLIYDVYCPWAPALASSYGIPAVKYLPSSACMLSFYHHFFKSPPGSDYPFTEIYLTDFERVKFLPMYDESVFESMRRSKKIFLIKSFREIEGKYLDHVSTLLDKRIVPVGPLIQEPIAGGEEEKDEVEAIEYMRWLDKKEPLSTVFVSFGSEYSSSKDEMEEVAKGLELLSEEVNFIWVIRFHKGGREQRKSAKEELPSGFLERVGERGLIVEGWAPQVKLLSHPAIGGFVSHCGWGSTIESMRLGVPIIAMPMQFDQPVNARLVAATGVGMVVERDDQGRFRGEEIAKVISIVVVEKVGESVRRKAKELRDIIGNKGDEEIDELARELVQLCREERQA
ncbi:hypothetical protein Dimus_036724 [Dionaea muscipula]